MTLGLRSGSVADAAHGPHERVSERIVRVFRCYRGAHGGTMRAAVALG
eukprot:COSAG02_NODE_50026_length_323_cov_0.691964_1_plen_47_part_01